MYSMALRDLKMIIIPTSRCLGSTRVISSLRPVVILRTMNSIILQFNVARRNSVLYGVRKLFIVGCLVTLLVNT